MARFFERVAKDEGMCPGRDVWRERKLWDQAIPRLRCAAGNSRLIADVMP
jgi:hypothetical protein